ncbi:hypothetical protein EG830_14635 [bacterium]|nr:hypothetical protein [bacterium]
MKKAFLLLALIAVSTGAFSQSDTTAVTYVAYWSVGDSYDFRVRKTNLEWDCDSLIRDETSEYIANFRVIDSSNTSYTVVWTYPNELLDTWDLPRDMLYELSKYRQSKVVYTTTQLGNLVGIKNWEEQAETIRSMTDDILSLLAKNPDTDFEETIHEAQSFLEKYSTKEGIEQMILEELNLFHFLFAAMIPVKDTIRYEEKLVPMDGFKPVRIDGKIWLENVDFDRQRSVLIQETKLNRNDAKAFLLELNTVMGVESADMPGAISRSVYSVNTLNRYDFRFNPGVPVLITSRRDIRVYAGSGKTRMEDSITIELL